MFGLGHDELIFNAAFFIIICLSCIVMLLIKIARQFASSLCEILFENLYWSPQITLVHFFEIRLPCNKQ